MAGSPGWDGGRLPGSSPPCNFIFTLPPAPPPRGPSVNLTVSSCQPQKSDLFGIRSRPGDLEAATPAGHIIRMIRVIRVIRALT